MEGCEYVLLTEDRYEETITLYKEHFLPDEPVARSIGLEWCAEYEDLIMSELEDNMSVGIVSKSTGNLVGFRIMSIISKDEHDIDTEEVTSEKFKIVEDFLNYLAGFNNVFEHYGVEDVVHFFGLGVHRDWRKKGIGSKLMQAAMTLVANLGIGPVVITGEGSSNYSKKIFEKFGFDILAGVVFADYKINGQEVFKNLGEHKCERLYGKIVY